MDRVVLIASDNMVFTDGELYGKTIYLAEGETADGWYEILEVEFVASIESGVPIGQISDTEALRIIIGGAV